MSKNKNSASRIKQLLEKAKAIPNKGVSEVWKEIFKIETDNNNKLYFEVSRCLNLLHDEIEFMRTEMASTEYSAYLYDPFLNKINQIIGVHTITSSWDGYQKQITPEIILCLGFCSEILPPDEKEIPEEQIEEITNLVQSLESSITDSELPAYTKRIINKHITNIREAIESYTVVGAKAFNEVVQAAYGEVIDNASIFEESKASKEITSLATIWQKVKVVSDGAVIVEKGVSATQKLAEHTTKAIEYIQGLGN